MQGYTQTMLVEAPGMVELDCGDEQLRVDAPAVKIIITQLDEDTLRYKVASLPGLLLPVGYKVVRPEIDPADRFLVEMAGEARNIQRTGAEKPSHILRGRRLRAIVGSEELPFQAARNPNLGINAPVDRLTSALGEAEVRYVFTSPCSFHAYCLLDRKGIKELQEALAVVAVNYPVHNCSGVL